MQLLIFSSPNTCIPKNSTYLTFVGREEGQTEHPHGSAKQRHVKRRWVTELKTAATSFDKGGKK
jgi:hypothetical protein